MILGTKVKVISWICVTDCRMEMITPTARPRRSIGAERLSTRISACWPGWRTKSGLIVLFGLRGPWGRAAMEARHEGADDEMPSVDEDEEQDLEGQRDGHRRQQQHAYAHQGGGHHHVDDEEGDVDQETH